MRRDLVGQPSRVVPLTFTVSQLKKRTSGFFSLVLWQTRSRSDGKRCCVLMASQR